MIRYDCIMNRLHLRTGRHEKYNFRVDKLYVLLDYGQIQMTNNANKCPQNKEYKLPVFFFHIEYSQQNLLSGKQRKDLNKT